MLKHIWMWIEWMKRKLYNSIIFPYYQYTNVFTMTKNHILTCHIYIYIYIYIDDNDNNLLYCLTNNLINNLINKFSVCRLRTECDTCKLWSVWYVSYLWKGNLETFHMNLHFRCETTWLALEFGLCFVVTSFGFELRFWCETTRFG